ncbi:uncharacterized protein Bfra_008819, partial [Botrytis fragariae]
GGKKACWQDYIRGKFQAPERLKEPGGQKGRWAWFDLSDKLAITDLAVRQSRELQKTIGGTEVVRMNVVHHGLGIDEQVLKK